MSFALNFPLLAIVASLLFSVISSVLSGKIARWLSMCLSLAVAVSSLFVLQLVYVGGEPITYIMGHFPHPWGNEIRIGLLESFFSFVFSLVMFLCMMGAKIKLSEDLEPSKSQFYYVMTDLIQVALLVLVYTNDIFTGYVFIEICTLASCGILMIRQIGRTTLASVRYMIFSLIGSGLFLLGVTILYNITGHLLLPSLHEAVAELARTGAYRIPLSSSICLITVGLAIKSGLFPFHYWMPDTYGYATPCSSGILSGLVSKGYIFFLLKVIFSGFGTQVFYGSGMQNVLFVFGICGMIFGSIGAIQENDIFRMLANSSAAQIGYVYLGIGISPEAGVIAALFHILTHAVTKPVLFLSASRLSDAAGGSKRFKDLQGCGYAFPLAGFAFSLGAMSMIGIPMTMGFMSKYLLATAGLEVSVKAVPTLLALALSTILNTFYFARTIIRLYTPGTPLASAAVVKAQPPFALSAICFSLLNLASGIFASPLIALLGQGLEYFGKVG